MGSKPSCKANAAGAGAFTAQEEKTKEEEKVTESVHQTISLSPLKSCGAFELKMQCDGLSPGHKALHGLAPPPPAPLCLTHRAPVPPDFLQVVEHPAQSLPCCPLGLGALLPAVCPTSPYPLGLGSNAIYSERPSWTADQHPSIYPTRTPFPPLLPFPISHSALLTL